MPFLKEIFLQLKVNKLFKANRTYSFTNYSELNREIFFSNNKKNKSLLKIIRPILFKNLPKSFLEDYKEILKFSEKLPWAKKLKKIFTAASNLYDDTFKIWLAEKRKDFKAKLIYCCHGGGFQTHSYSSLSFFSKNL